MQYVYSASDCEQFRPGTRCEVGTRQCQRVTKGATEPAVKASNLVGMSAHRQPGEGRYLWAAQIEHWLRLLWKEKAELRGMLSQAFPAVVFADGSRPNVHARVYPDLFASSTFPHLCNPLPIKLLSVLRQTPVLQHFVTFFL